MGAGRMCVRFSGVAGKALDAVNIGREWQAGLEVAVGSGPGGQL
jgi:hypothetical protein